MSHEQFQKGGSVINLLLGKKKSEKEDLNRPSSPHSTNPASGSSSARSTTSSSTPSSASYASGSASARGPLPSSSSGPSSARGAPSIISPPSTPTSTPSPSGTTPPIGLTASPNNSSLETLISPRKGSNPASLTPAEAVLLETFWHAINDGAVEAVSLLLDKHPELMNARDESGMSPLHVVCKGGTPKLSLCFMLLNRGADVTLETVNGTSPLHYLVGNLSKEDPRISGVLLKMLGMGADVNRRSAQGESALHYACSGRSLPQVINFLLKQGADVDSINTQGYTPLHLAILQKKHDIVKLLLNKGASLTTYSKHGSCLELAKKEENILEVLWTAGFGEFLKYPSWSTKRKKRNNQASASSASSAIDSEAGFIRLEQVLDTTETNLTRIHLELTELHKVLVENQEATQESWEKAKERTEKAFQLLNVAIQHCVQERVDSSRLHQEHQQNLHASGNMRTIVGDDGEFNEFNDLQAFEICEGYHYNNFGLTATQEVLYTIPFNEIRWYDTYFNDKEHQNFVGTHVTLGTIIISIVKEPTAYRLLVRSKFGDAKILIPVEKLEGGGKNLSSFKLLTSCNPLFSHVPFRTIEGEQLSPALVQFEASMMSNQLKFGVLLAHEGQTEETEMFANDSHPLFDEFLALLGETIKLEGWSGYAGGLDVKSNCTGTHSVFTKHEGWEVMFHVSTLLPKSTVDEQQIERKKHLGNDICLLVFNTGKTRYNPKMIRTQFIHIIVVVQVAEMNADGTAASYRVEVAYNSQTPPFQPTLTSPPIYPKTKARKIVLSKLINGEVTARLDNISFFAKKMRKPRLQLLEELVKKF